MSLTSHRCCGRLKILKQAWIFSASHIITPPGSCIHRKAINKNKPSLSSGVLPSRQQYHIGDYPGTPPPSVYQVTQSTALQAEYGVYRLPGTPPSSVYQVTHGTALQAAECCVRHLVMVIPSRQQSAMCSICPARIVLEDCHAIGHSSVLSA